MDYKLVYSKNAENDLERLGMELARRILKKLDFFIRQKDPMDYATQLSGFDLPMYRFRVGDYRVVFRKNPKTEQLVILVVIKIRH